MVVRNNDVPNLPRDFVTVFRGKGNRPIGAADDARFLAELVPSSQDAASSELASMRVLELGVLYD